MASSLIVGVSTNDVNDINGVLDDALNKKFDFICVPLFHPRLRRDSTGISRLRDSPGTRSDTTMESRSEHDVLQV